MRVKMGFMALAFLGLAACGGGGDSSNSTPTTANVQGNWQGSYTISGVSGSTPITAVIQSGGFGFFFDTNGVIYVLPQLSGSTTLSGTITAYAPAGTTFADGHTQDNFSVSGTASDTSISGTFSGNGETGTFSLSSTTPFTGTPALNPGAVFGFYVGVGSGAVNITLNGGGSFFGSDSNGCMLTGQITQVGSQNLYTVVVHSTGTSSLCAGTLTGLGFESNADAGHLFGGSTGTYFYIGVANTSDAFVAELNLI